MAPAPATDAPAERRRYDSPVRRRQVAETRERILGAGPPSSTSSPAGTGTG